MATATASNGAAPTPQPIFLSGSHHREVCFGQEVVPAPAMLAELRQRRKIAEEKAARKAKGLDVKSGAGRSSKRKTGNVSVKELIDFGLLKPGKGTVTVTYKGTIYRASLLETGQIDFNGQIYDAPGAFSMFAKRLMTPAKAGDDGWRSVHVDGFSLEEYKQRYLSQKAADEAKAAAAAAAPAEGADGAAAGAEGGSKPSSDGGAAPADAKVKEEKIVVEEPSPSIYMTQLPPDELPPLPSAFDLNIPGETDGAELEEEAGDDEPDTSNWVQCSRCSAWRVVPDEFWPDIDAANEEDWFCEEATWDLTQYDPFTMACKEFKK